MKQKIYSTIRSIVLLLFIVTGCKQSNSKPHQKIVTDSIKTGNDSSEIQPLEEKDVFDKPKTFAFNLKNKKFELCYVKAEKIYFYDIESSEKLVFPENEFCCQMTFSDDYKTMYYTSTFGEYSELFLKVAYFNDSTVTTKWLKNLGKEKDNFLTDTYSEKGLMILVNDTLYIETDYEWLAGFGKVIKYSVKDDKLFLDQENNVYRQMTNKPNYYSPTDSLSNFIKHREINGAIELFNISGNDSVQLTHTSELDKEYFGETDGEFQEDKWFSILDISNDTSNILVGVVTGMGDLGHGPYYLVDIYGKGQALLNSDGYGSDLSPLWLPDGRNIAAINMENNDNGVLHFTTKNNKLIKVDDNVDYIDIRDIN